MNPNDRPNPNARPTTSKLPDLPEGYTYRQRNKPTDFHQSSLPRNKYNELMGAYKYIGDELYRSAGYTPSINNRDELEYKWNAVPTIPSINKDFIDNVFKNHNPVKASNLRKNEKYYMVQLNDKSLRLFLVTITQTGHLKYKLTRELKNGSMESITPIDSEHTYNTIFLETVPKTSSGLNSTRRRKQRQNKSRRLRLSRRNYRK